MAFIALGLFMPPGRFRGSGRGRLPTRVEAVSPMRPLLIVLAALVGLLGAWQTRQLDALARERDQILLESQVREAEVRVNALLARARDELRRLPDPHLGALRSGYLLPRDFDPDEPGRGPTFALSPDLAEERMARKQLAQFKADDALNWLAEENVVSVALRQDGRLTGSAAGGLNRDELARAVGGLRLSSLQPVRLQAARTPDPDGTLSPWWVLSLALLAMAFWPRRRPAVAAAIPVPKTIDRDALVERVGGKRENLLTLVRTFERSAPERLKALEAATTGPALAEAAHSLKGSLLNFGADPSLARELEQDGRAGLMKGIAPRIAAVRAQVEALLPQLHELCEEMRDERRGAALTQGSVGRILVVDDEPTNRELLASALRSDGHSVDQAESAAVALEMTAQNRYDAILLDVLMPGMSGFDACRHLRAEPKTAAIPVLLVTALEERHDRLRGIQAGANDFITKPIDVRELTLRVRNAVHGHRLYEELQENYRKLADSRAQLLHSTRLAVVGQLAAGVAHELNNPLGSILMVIETLEEDGPDSEDAPELLSNARKAAVRARSIIDKLLYYARKEPAERETVDLNVVVDESLALLRKTLAHEGVELVVGPSPRPLAVKGNSNELQQILVNLVVNARDAVLAGGEKRVTVTVREEGTEAVLEVRDGGPGLSQELREKIFDPFFTTKPVGRGTGLGLSVSQQIAEAHGGRLLVLETPPPGAVFQLRLQKS